MKRTVAVFLLSAMLLGAASLARGELQIHTVATGLSQPTSITQPPDKSGRLFVTLQRGRVMVLKGDLPASTFLDLTSLVSCCGERGLLSIAFHPDYVKNGFFFVNYTDANGDTVVARYRVSSNPDRADPASAQVLLKVEQPYPNHNGGLLLFGPDGYLYIGMGDGGSGGDPGNRAQNLGTLLGKMLRIDVNGKAPYAIPPDNPFLKNPAARPEIWAYGLRNPWRFSFDRRTGDLFIADVGQDKWEEVNFQPASSKGGENYGWRLMEGNHCFNPPANCNQGDLVLPIAEYGHALGCSITGGYIYLGEKIPGLQGAYLYADYCSGRIWGARRLDGGKWEPEQLLASPYRISTFGEDGEGEIYFADYEGRGLFKIVGLTAK
ncbi:MAG: PQQ-dependent sugar dehydrogenase [Syntrophobacteraceae bacterium]